LQQYLHVLEDITADVLSIANQARSRKLGTLSPSFNIQNLTEAALEKVPVLSLFFTNSLVLFTLPIFFFFCIYQMMRICE